MNPHVISTALVTCRKVFVDVVSDRQSLSPSFERNGNGVTIWRERKKQNKASFKWADWLEFLSVQRTLIFWFGYNQTGFKWE